MKKKPLNLLQVLDYQEALSMTSLEISELTKSRHDNVKRSIERLADDGVIQLPPLEEVENNQTLSPNNSSLVYIFNGAKGKRDTLVVIARLSPEFTATLVDRWEELEKENLKLLQETINAELTLLRAASAETDVHRLNLLRQHTEDTDALQRVEQRLEQYKKKVRHLEADLSNYNAERVAQAEWVAKAREYMQEQKDRISHLKRQLNAAATHVHAAREGYNDLMYNEYSRRFAKWKPPFTVTPDDSRVQDLIKLGWLEDCGTRATPIGEYLVNVRPVEYGRYSYSYSHLGKRCAGQLARALPPLLAELLVQIPSHTQADLGVLGITADDLGVRRY